MMCTWKEASEQDLRTEQNVSRSSTNGQQLRKEGKGPLKKEPVVSK